MKAKRTKISLSVIITLVVMGIVIVTILSAFFIFLKMYFDSTKQNAIVRSEQAVVQVSNTVYSYTEDMKEIMLLIENSYLKEKKERNKLLQTLIKVRSDVIAVICYNENQEIIDCWTGDHILKSKILENLSYVWRDSYKKGELYISKPHVETLLYNYYPWVVSIMQEMQNPEGEKNMVVMDIQFSNIANYVDDVGIGTHGYCFIMDTDGNIIYHPQQQLIYSGLKEERTKHLLTREDGSFLANNIIYTLQTIKNSNWRIVGVSYIEELVTSRIKSIISILILLLIAVLVTALISSYVLSRMISKPIQRLVKAMGEFENNTEKFTYKEVYGSSEIIALSESFGHMVVQIQELMNQVRKEEISLRKTELKALQAQINPHFLYNTLDAIEWLCEEERNKDAVEMVNALAKLFRISISKGHELIPIEKEIEHAKSYLKIQNFRYKNQFTYIFEIQEQCLGYLCNKITLQPIIENAIYHGIDRMVEIGEIKIRVKEEGENIIFEVEDNGIGMSEEQCNNILKREPKDNSGIGIKNVNDRIKIYFGDKYGIYIKSKLDIGTCVRICMPKVMEDYYEVK